MTSTDTSPPAVADGRRLRELIAYLLRLGATGFGGPIALVGYMQRDLVERRAWITPREYSEGLAFSQLAPGPLAAQLAIYLGWVRGGTWGATLAGVAFVLPSFLMVLALSLLYVRYGGLPWMQGAFYGVGAAVVAIIARSVVRLARMSLKRDPLLWLLFAGNAAVVVVTQTELLSVIFASGVGALVARAAPSRSASTAVGLFLPVTIVQLNVAAGASSAPGVLWQVFWFFVKAGAVVFGSGLAIVPFLYGGAVQQYAWLGERQFLDAIAVSMITPGPVVITVAFIGYLVSGLPGAVLAALGVFLPVYLAVVLGAPLFNRVARNPQLAAFVAGVTAAATGALAGAAVILARRAIVDGPTLAVALVTLALLVWARKVPEPAVLLAAGCAGILLAPA